MGVDFYYLNGTESSRTTYQHYLILHEGNPKREAGVDFYYLNGTESSRTTYQHYLILHEGNPKREADSQGYCV